MRAGWLHGFRGVSDFENAAQGSVRCGVSDRDSLETRRLDLG
jgi:hypothetical protein